MYYCLLSVLCVELAVKNERRMHILSIKNPKAFRAHKWLALLVRLHFPNSATFDLRSWVPLLAKSWIRTCYDIPNPPPSERNSFRLCELIYLYDPFEHPQQIVGMETGGSAQPLADPPVHVLKYTRVVLTVLFRFSGALYCEARVWNIGTVRCWM